MYLNLGCLLGKHKALPSGEGKGNEGNRGMSDGEYLVPTSFWKQNKTREYPAVEEGGGQGGGWRVERVQV